MGHDRYGLPLGTTSAAARAAYVDAMDRLLSAAPGPIDSFELVRVGGSAAQRDVFEDTLLGAYLRAGRTEQAEAALRARVARRPAIRPVTVAGG
jgi:hypothetical protein